MKKCIIILFLCFISFTIYKYKAEGAFIKQIDLDVKDGETAVVFMPLKQNIYLWVENTQNTILLPVIQKGSEKPTQIMNMLSNKEIQYSYDTLFKANQYVSLEKPLVLDNMTIQKENTYTKIQMGEDSFCIYNNGEIPPCEYVYFLKPHKIEKGTLKLAFYGEEAGTNFENDLYDHWIDLYKIRREEYTIVKFSKNNYNVMRIPDYYLSFS